MQEFQPGNLLALPFIVTDTNTPKSTSAHMANLGVSGQLNLGRNEVHKLQDPISGLRPIAGAGSHKIIAELRKHHSAPQELAIVQALLLGKRQDISPGIYSNYAAAGVIHILAVSGLEVGIILLLLNHLLKPVKRIRYGNQLKNNISYFHALGFALLSGLSPSVVLAVSKFSFIAIAMQLNRCSSVLHAIFTSLIFLLPIALISSFRLDFNSVMGRYSALF